MKDIENRKDIEQLVNTFYAKVIRDKQIAFFFNDIAKVDWEKHFPRMYDFWETILFDKVIYKGNPMLPHLALHKKVELEAVHYTTWLNLWISTINELFQGELADEAIKRAKLMANLIAYKTKKQAEKGFIQ